VRICGEAAPYASAALLAYSIRRGSAGAIAGQSRQQVVQDGAPQCAMREGDYV
jgi:hypothetical protein